MLILLGMVSHGGASVRGQPEPPGGGEKDVIPRVVSGYMECGISGLVT